MSECDDIFKLLGGMTLEDTKKLKEDTSGKLEKKKEKAVLRKLCAGGGVKKMKKKKKGAVVVEKKKKKIASAGKVEHRRRVGAVKTWNEGPRGKQFGKMYYGVQRSVLGTMFMAEISHPDGRFLSLGTFKSDRRAAIAYDQAAIQIYGPNTPLNFPPPTANNNN